MRTARLIWVSGLVRWGDFGISVDEGDEVVGDGEVVGLCLLGDVVFDVGGECECEGGGSGGVFGGSAFHGWECIRGFLYCGLCLVVGCAMVLT